jgi:hypothetical protein
MGANRALATKCAPDGFRESLARFRADRPPTSLASVGRILSRFLGQGGAGFDATLFPSSKRGLPTVGPLGFQLERRVEHPDAPGRARAEFLAPHVGRKRLRASSGASSRGDLGQQAFPERGPLRPSYPQGPLSHAGGNAGILCYRTKIELGWR